MMLTDYYNSDPALGIAIEHVRWAYRNHLSAAEVGDSVGDPTVKNWPQAVWAITRAWRGLEGKSL